MAFSAYVDVSNCTSMHGPFDVDRVLYRSKAVVLTDKPWQTLKWFKLFLSQSLRSTLCYRLVLPQQNLQLGVCAHTLAASLQNPRFCSNRVKFMALC